MFTSNKHTNFFFQFKREKENKQTNKTKQKTKQKTYITLVSL